MSFLLDTCYLSEFVKEQPGQKVVEWSEKQQEDELYIRASRRWFDQEEKQRWKDGLTRL